MTKPNSPVTVTADAQVNDVCAEDALDDLRHNRSHPVPPGMRGAWLATKPQRLSEEHLSATDETTTTALGVKPSNEESRGPDILRNRRAQRMLGVAACVVLFGGVAGWLLTTRAKEKSANPDATADSAVVPSIVSSVKQAPSASPVTGAPSATPLGTSNHSVSKTPTHPKKQTTPPNRVPSKAQRTTQVPSDDDEAIFKSR